jgi:hypothetical protein
MRYMDELFTGQASNIDLKKKEPKCHKTIDIMMRYKIWVENGRPEKRIIDDEEFWGRWCNGFRDW